MDCNTGAKAKLRAAANVAAQEEAKRRGYSQFRIDEESLKTLEDTIHIREIEVENTRSQRSTHAVVYSNRSAADYVMPESREVNVRQDAKLTAEYSAKVDSKMESPQMAKVDLKQTLCAKGEDEVHVHTRYALGHLPVPGQCAVHFNSVHHAETGQYELGTEGNVLIVVNPGHPIAKHAVIGGVAGTAAGGAVGVGAGSMIGGVVGVIAGPPGILAGLILGGAIGGLVGAGSGGGAIGAVGSAIGAARGVTERHKRQFTITAKDVFRKLPNFREEGGNVYCQITVTHEWDEERREITEN